MLKEYKDKISDDNRKKVDGAVETVKEALKKDDADAMKSAEESLTEVWHAISTELYSKAKAQARPSEPQEGGEKPSGSADGKNKDRVVDANFEMVDDDKEK